MGAEPLELVLVDVDPLAEYGPLGALEEADTGGVQAFVEGGGTGGGAGEGDALLVDGNGSTTATLGPPGIVDLEW